jgi:predicted ribosome quality control (RQC) complex YloA/Tae2 family protein
MSAYSRGYDTKVEPTCFGDHATLRMKTELLHIPFPVTFYIGRSQQENHDVIDLGGPNDLWFHVADQSSCHVVAILPVDCDRKQRSKIIRHGARLCKQYTNSVKSASNVPITYAPISHVAKDTVPGRVHVTRDMVIIV